MSDDKDVPMEDKDIPMDDIAEEDENKLLGVDEPTKTTESLDDGMKDIKLENSEETKDSETQKETVDENSDVTVPEDDDGAFSDAEFAADDDRSSVPEEMKWRWHIEMYPIAVDDLQLDNFIKMCNIAMHFQIFYKTNFRNEKKGEVHLYTEEMQAAKNIVRTMCCRKFSNIRPYVYIYRRMDETSENYEMASLRLDLVDAAKMRWDRQKKSQGEASSRIAKVSNVPVGTSKELLNVVFARAFQVKRETDKSAGEEKQNEEKAENTDKPEGNHHDDDDDDDDGGKERKGESSAEEKEENIAEEDELVGEFNGTVTVDCSSRTSLKGFLLGYRKVFINQKLLEIKPLDPTEVNVEAIRKEARKKRKEAIKGKEWVPASPPRRYSNNEQMSSVAAAAAARGRGGNSYGGRARGANQHGGGRGGGSNVHRGGGQGSGWSRGGLVMTGRQKMNEKSMRRGGGGGGPGRDIRGLSSFSHEIMMLQSQLQMNTMELQRQIASLNAAEHLRDFRADYPRDFRRDYPPHAYGMPRHGSWMDDSWDYPESSRGRHGGGRKPRGNRR